jgi:hypothetical protein
VKAKHSGEDFSRDGMNLLSTGSTVFFFIFTSVPLFVLLCSVLSLVLQPGQFYPYIVHLCSILPFRQ